MTNLLQTLLTLVKKCTKCLFPMCLNTFSYSLLQFACGNDRYTSMTQPFMASSGQTEQYLCCVCVGVFDTSFLSTEKCF